MNGHLLLGADTHYSRTRTRHGRGYLTGAVTAEGRGAPGTKSTGTSRVRAPRGKGASRTLALCGYWHVTGAGTARLRAPHGCGYVEI